MLHASDSTPDPITPVTISSTAVHMFPSQFKYSILKNHPQDFFFFFKSERQYFPSHSLILSLFHGT